MPRLNFVPARDGFHFANSFTNNLPLGIKTYGLCGGMGLAAFSYMTHQLPIPTHATGNADFVNTEDVPPEGTRLRQFIFDRQMDTFLFAAPFLVMPWDNNAGWHFRSCMTEFNNIKRIIDRGNFSLLGLRGAQLVGDGGGHQVLVYGYDESPKRLYIYDSNFPDREIVLLIDEPAMQLLHNGNAGSYSSFFNMMELNPRTPNAYIKPYYIDLGIKSGLTISVNPKLGGRVSFSATIKNYGEFNAHVDSFLIWLRDPSGRNVDYMTGGMKPNPLFIPKGQEITISGESQAFGTVEGVYRAGVCYLSKQGQWINIPAVENNSRSQLDFFVGSMHVMDAMVQPFPVPLHTPVQVHISAVDRGSHQPVNAEVYYDNRKVGTANTPFSLTLNPKRKIVWVRDGNRMVKEIVEYVPLAELRASGYPTAYVDISDLGN